MVLGRVLVWDATCPDTLAPSHSSLAIREAGADATEAKLRKRQIYVHLEVSYLFVPAVAGLLGKRLESFSETLPATFQQLH